MVRRARQWPVVQTGAYRRKACHFSYGRGEQDQLRLELPFHLCRYTDSVLPTRLERTAQQATLGTAGGERSCLPGSQLLYLRDSSATTVLNNRRAEGPLEEETTSGMVGCAGASRLPGLVRALLWNSGAARNRNSITGAAQP